MVAPESFQGSTSRFCRVRQGVLLKYPAEVWRESSAYQKLTDEIANNFSVERQILVLLGEHPRIVSYLGWQDSSRGSQNALFHYTSQEVRSSWQRWLGKLFYRLPLPEFSLARLVFSRACWLRTSLTVNGFMSRYSTLAVETLAILLGPLAASRVKAYAAERGHLRGGPWIGRPP